MESFMQSEISENAFNEKSVWKFQEVGIERII